MLRSAVLFTLAALLSLPAGAQTAAPLSAGEKSVANFAFATQLGSGIYTIDGRTIQIYRLPIAYTVRPETENRWGLKLTFPVTIGFYDFEPMDVLDTGVPENLDTVSLVPGLEFRVPIKKVLLKPFFEAGVAREGSQDTVVAIYSFGLRAFTGFTAGKFDIDLGNALLWSAVDPTEDGGEKDSFRSLQTSVRARHGMGIGFKGRELEWGLYASGELYVDVPDFPLASADSDRNAQYEVGATIDVRDKLKIWKFKLPGLGLGYRFGPGTDAIRFVIGTPTPVLKR